MQELLKCRQPVRNAIKITRKKFIQSFSSFSFGKKVLFFDAEEKRKMLEIAAALISMVKSLIILDEEVYFLISKGDA